jgi:hypothetical protein
MPETASESPESLATLDLFALGRQASAAREGQHGRRGTFVRARQLLASGGWRGPRDAAESAVDDADLTAVGGLPALRTAGIDLLVAPADSSHARAAAEAGLRILLRVPYRLGEDDRGRLERLAAIDGAAYDVWGVMPSPVGEPYGLDTLRFFALCRLAQMAFGFGADELFAPIVAERALRLGANAHNPALTRKEAATLLRGAGLTPCERFADGTIEEVSL